MNLKLALVLSAFFLLTAGCETNNNPESETTENTKDSALNNLHQVPGSEYTWILESLYGRDVPDIAGNSMPELKFDAGEKRFVGSTGCNQIHGNIESGEGGAILFVAIVQTKRACADMGMEDAFKAMIEATRYFKQTDGKLDFMDHEKTVIGSFSGVGG